MYGLTQHTPVTTSITALSAASFVGFCFNQLAQAERIASGNYRDIPDNENNQLLDYTVNGFNDDKLNFELHQQQSLTRLDSQDISRSNSVANSNDDFSAVMELSSLDGSNGFQINGTISGSSGRSVSGAGDVNGDGYSDVIIGAPYADPHSKISAGESYVVFGKSTGFDTVKLSELDGNNGFQMNGISLDGHSGYSVSGAGDVNGDGYSDVIIGAPDAEPHGQENIGESYVVFGKSSKFNATIELSSLDGSNGFQINGVLFGYYSGYSVSGAGDVNADGYDDVIIGAYGASQSYVVFGKSSTFNATIELSSLDGNNGFQLDGIALSDYSGYSVSGAGDVNADGYDDVIIGAYGARPHNMGYAGESYVVFGKPSDFSIVFELSSLDGDNGFQINGIAKRDQSGY